MERPESGEPYGASSPRIALLSIHMNGHRRSYVERFSRICVDAGWSSTLLRSWDSGAKHKDPLFVLMIEESFVAFTMIAMTRALRGRRTAGLLFAGAGLVNSRGIKAAAKRFVLRFLTKVPNITVLAITPFAVVPGLVKLADGWIYDPQLWDLDDAAPRSSPLADEVRKAAAGRTVVVALGRQGREKGFDRLVRLWRSSAILRDRCLFVSAGKVDDNLQADAAVFQDAGGYLVDRFVSDDEMLSLYGVSDLVWALYDQVYDQSSGIMGRAIQLGRPSIVRGGSQLEDLARHLGVPVVTAPWDDDPGAVDAILSSVGRLATDPSVTPRLKAVSLDVLHRHVFADGASAGSGPGA